MAMAGACGSSLRTGLESHGRKSEICILRSVRHQPGIESSRMTDLNSTAPLPAGAEAQPTAARHPATFAPATFVLLLALSVFGAVIGVQLILQLGVTPNTSIIGALVAMILARVPIAIFARYRSIHVQNLAQSAISAATFGAANSLLLPIGVPFLLGRSDLILPMLVGAALSMLLDAYLLYRMFDTRIFPATGAWPPGVAAAEAIKAGDVGGRKAALLGLGILVGMFGSWFKIPMSAFGVAFIGNIWALSMFGIGLLIRGYTQPLTGIDISRYYVPHGFMVGAGLIALGASRPDHQPARRRGSGCGSQRRRAGARVGAGHHRLSGHRHRHRAPRRSRLANVASDADVVHRLCRLRRVHA